MQAPRFDNVMLMFCAQGTLVSVYYVLKSMLGGISEHLRRFEEIAVAPWSFFHRDEDQKLAMWQDVAS